MKETFAIIAALLAVAGNVPYLIDIWKGRAKPHPYTWFVWSLVSGTVLFGQIAKGAGIGALPTAASELFTILIFLLSLAFGFRDGSRVDTVFLLCALSGIGLWIFTDDATYAVVVAVAVDVVAFIPTLRKAWRYPATETSLLYSSNIARHILALFSLQAYNLATTLHSIAMITSNCFMVLILLSKKIPRR